MYNLVYTGSSDCPVPEDNEEIVSSLVSAMKEWSAHTDSGECPPMMCYMLEHEYCEASLSFELLKNTDRAVAIVLKQARKEVDFDLYVGQINLTENWSAGCDYGRWGPSYVAVDLMEVTSEGKNLKSPEGHSIPKIEVKKQCYVPEGFFDKLDPDEEEIEEATGNAGATMDKQYSWAAILFWPTRLRATHFGVSDIISKLSLDLAAPCTNKDELTEVARGILCACTLKDNVYRSGISADTYLSLFQSLLKIGNTELVLDGLKVILGSSASVIAEPSFADKVVHVGSTYGWNMLTAPFAKVSASSSGIGHYCKFLNGVLGSQPSDVQKNVCVGLCRAIISALAASQSRPMSPESYVCLFESLLNIGDVALISEGIKSLLNPSCSSLLSRNSFCHKVYTVGRVYGWNMLKPPLEAVLSASSSGIADCCKLLCHILASQPSDVQKDICLDLARAITSALLVSHHSLYPESSESLLECLLKIGDAALISEGLKSILHSSSSSLLSRASFGDKVLTVGRTFGWSMLKPPLETGFRHLSTSSSGFVDCCKLLGHFLGSQPSRFTEGSL